MKPIVGMTTDKGRLRLQWKHEGKQYYLYLLLDDTKVNRVKAKDIQLLIEADIETGCLDTTLAKYRPHKATGKQLSDLTCSELFDDWLKYKTAYCDKRTIEYYKGVKRRLIQYFANKRSRDITKKDTLGFFAWLKTRDICGETFQRRLESLTACWNWAIENGYLTDNPWIGLSKLVKVPSKPKPKPFTLDEINRIVDGFNNHLRYSQLTPFIKFLFGTGCRTGEAIGLRWKNLSNDCSTCTISEQLTRGKRKSTKTGKVRSFTLSPSTQQMLLEHRPSTYKPDDLVFKWNGKPINDINLVRRVWKPLLEQQGIPYRYLYNTRHTFISHCLEKGMNPVVIAQITGHDVNVLFNHYAGSLHSQPSVPDIVIG